MTSRRTGVLGGTFDPPHIGHLRVAEDVRREWQLGEVLLVPAGEPPHKMGMRVTSSALRLEMTRAAVRGVPGLEVSDIEVERAGPSYMVDTLRSLVAERPEDEWFLVIGADQWAEFGSWRESEEVARLAHVLVMARNGSDPSALESAVEESAGASPAGTVRWSPVAVTRVDVSSTEIRERVRAGASIEEMVPGSVAEIIARENLYRDVEC